MPTTQRLSITLPLDVAEAIKAKVRAGEYASESEVIRDGLRVLLERDDHLNSWLSEEVGPACDAIRADPSRAVAADDIRARLALRHATAKKK